MTFRRLLGLIGRMTARYCMVLESSHLYPSIDPNYMSSCFLSASGRSGFRAGSTRKARRSTGTFAGIC